MLIRFGDILWEDAYGFLICVSTGPTDEWYGGEVVQLRRGVVHRAPAHGYDINENTQLWRVTEPESKDGARLRIQVRDWAEFLVGTQLRLSIWNRLLKWLGRREAQDPEALMMGLVLFRKPSMFKSPEDVFEHLNHVHSKWTKLNERRTA